MFNFERPFSLKHCLVHAICGYTRVLCYELKGADPYQRSLFDVLGMYITRL